MLHILSSLLVHSFVSPMSHGCSSSLQFTFLLFLLVFSALSPCFLFLFHFPISHHFLSFTILSPPLSTSLHSHLFPSLPTPITLPSPVFLDSCSTYLCFLLHILTVTPLSLCLHVLSQVDWPLNIIITDNCMNKYNRLFSFLLQLKHMVWSLRDVWFHLKRTGERRWELLIQVQLRVHLTFE